MNRVEMIKFIKNFPNVKISHVLFSADEYIYSKEDGNVYTEEGYLFEDWVSEGLGAHNGIRIRDGYHWLDGWKVVSGGEFKNRNRKNVF